MDIPKIFIITGPSGVGKTSIAEGILTKGLPIKKVVTTTTRDEIRAGEKPGEDYHFVTEEEFKVLVEGGEIFEWTTYAGHKYGTRKTDIQKILDDGNIPLWVIDPPAAAHFKETWPQSIGIFIAPESLGILQDRLRNRGEEPADIKARVALAEAELKQAAIFDYQVINFEGELSQAVDEVADIIEQEL